MNYSIPSLKIPGLLLTGLLLAAGCVKKEDPTPANTSQSTLNFRFTPVVGNQPLVLNTAWYTTAAGDSFRVTTHKYFVSNFSLTNDAGQEIALPDSVFLVDAAAPRTFTFTNLPQGHYTNVSFLIGVDSARNVSGIQSGELDPNGRAAGMFWTWNTGYIMAKTEGFSPQSTTATQSIIYHIAGFSGRFSALRRITLSLPATMHLHSAATGPTVQVQSDLASWFSGATPVRFAAMPELMSVGSASAAIANNYSKGYRVVRIDP